MRSLQGQRSVARVFRGLVVGTAILGMAQAASARDDAGVHEFFNSMFGGAGGQDGGGAAQESVSPAPAPRPAPVFAPATRSRSVPFEARAKRAERRAVAARAPHDRPLTVMLHRPKTASARQAALVPTRPATVSIFEDRTLRRGDAVMTTKGIRIFAGSSSWPYRDSDFVAIADARKMDKSMEKILLDLDRLPRG